MIVDCICCAPERMNWIETDELMEYQIFLCYKLMKCLKKITKLIIFVDKIVWKK